MSLWTIYSIAEWLLRLVMVLVILRRRFTSPVALAWLCLVFFQPELGTILYLLLGDHRLGRRRLKTHRQLIQTLRSQQSPSDSTADPSHPHIQPVHQSIIAQAQTLGGFNILTGNRIQILDDAPATLSQLIADIDAAEKHVHLLFYIFAPDDTGHRVAQALFRAQKRGVSCRLLADASGSSRLFKRGGLASQLNAAGIQTIPMLPAAPLRRRLARLDIRNHRKLAIIDGTIAYTGSQNIVNFDYGHRGLRWIDLMARFTGPVVSQLQTVFLEDWTYETDQPFDHTLLQPHILPHLPDLPGETAAQTIPTGPSEDDHDALPRILLTAINAAQRQIIITTPYLVPDEPTTLALAMAADRGVHVSIVLPAKSDHRFVNAAAQAYFDTLMANDIHIHLFHDGLLHSKTMTVDDSFALLGSSNLDIRSFYINFEINVLMYGPEITQRLRLAQQRYLQASQPIDPVAWANRPIFHRYLQQAAALFSPLL